MVTTTAVPSLAPYVPRVVREWLDDDPSTLHRRIEGSIVFVDISGFTRMSERLARFGQARSCATSRKPDSLFSEQ